MLTMPVIFDSIPTPCYVLDESILRNNLETIKRVREKAGVEILLALKGFAMWSVFPIIKEYGFTCSTACSYNEARLAFEELGTKVHTYCPAYSEKDFDKILALSSHITFNSLSQFEKFQPVLKKSR